MGCSKQFSCMMYSTVMLCVSIVNCVCIKCTLLHHHECGWLLLHERMATAGEDKWLSEKSQCLYSALCRTAAAHSQLPLRYVWGFLQTHFHTETLTSTGKQTSTLTHTQAVVKYRGNTSSRTITVKSTSISQTSILVSIMKTSSASKWKSAHYALRNNGNLASVSLGLMLLCHAQEQ